MPGRNRTGAAARSNIRLGEEATTSDNQGEAMSEESMLHVDYANAGFRGRLGFGNRAVLLVIDMVRAYLEPGAPLFADSYPGVESSTRLLLDQARQRDVPVVFTNVSYHSSGVDGGYFWKKVPGLAVLRAGSRLGEFGDVVFPQPSELVVTKQYASAFCGTSLAATLRAIGCDTLIVTGVSTSGCVRATATEGISLGFIPIVVREAVGDRVPSIQEANLFDLDAKYADVVGIEEALEYITKQPMR